MVEVRRPLVGLAAEEAVELIEPRPRGPAVGGAGGAHFPGRGLVVLAEEARAVAVQAHHLRERGHVVRALSGVARKGGGGLRDPAHVVHVVVAAAEQRCPRGRADGGGVELVEAQALAGQPVGGGHVDGPTEGTRHAEAHVVDEHDQHVRRALRRPHFESRGRSRVPGVEFGLVRIVRLPDRQRGAIDHEWRPGRLRLDRGFRPGARQGDNERARSRAGQPSICFHHTSPHLRTLLNSGLVTRRHGPFILCPGPSARNGPNDSSARSNPSPPHRRRSTARRSGDGPSVAPGRARTAAAC